MKANARNPGESEADRRSKRKALACVGVLALVFALTATAGAEETGSREGVVIRAGDSIGVSVFGEPSLERSLVVGPSGRISYPLLGSLTAAGKTSSEFASEIERLLETNYIKDAHVSVAMVDRALQRVSIVGEVQNPGVVELSADDDLNLYAAVAAAGGVTDRADSTRLLVKRRTGSKVTDLHVELNSSRAFQLAAGDTVVVPAQVELPAITVLGQVKKPGALPMTRGNEVDLLEAIAITGGFTEFARPSKVKVRREGSSGTETFTIDASKIQEEGVEAFVLVPGDTVIIPNRIF